MFDFQEKNNAKTWFLSNSILILNHENHLIPGNCEKACD